MKMYKDGKVATVDKEQIPAMIAGGWSKEEKVSVVEEDTKTESTDGPAVNVKEATVDVKEATVEVSDPTEKTEEPAKKPAKKILKKKKA